MKVVIEVNSSSDFDYEHFIDWLNDELSNANMADGEGNYLEATIVGVDGKNK